MYIGPAVEDVRGGRFSKKRPAVGDAVVIPSPFGDVRAKIKKVEGEWDCVAVSTDPPAEWRLEYSDYPDMEGNHDAAWHCAAGRIKGTKKWFENGRQRG